MLRRSTRIAARGNDPTVQQAHRALSYNTSREERLLKRQRAEARRALRNAEQALQAAIAQNDVHTQAIAHLENRVQTYEAQSATDHATIVQLTAQLAASQAEKAQIENKLNQVDKHKDIADREQALAAAQAPLQQGSAASPARQNELDTPSDETLGLGNSRKRKRSPAPDPYRDLVLDGIDEVVAKKPRLDDYDIQASALPDSTTHYTSRDPPIGPRQAELDQLHTRLNDIAAIRAYGVEFGVAEWRQGEQISGAAGNILYKYAGRDIDGEAQCHIVVKDVYMDDFVLGADQSWFPNAGDANRVPNEIVIMHQLDALRSLDPKQQSYCMRLLHAEHFPSKRRYRMYMKCCPYPDLYDVVEAHRNAKRYLPEGFVLHLANCLLRGVHQLAYGTSDRRTQIPGWKKHEIVHRDLKLENVFLDDNPSNRFRGYPAAILGDFGHAVITSEDDPVNPVAYAITVGTDGWIPPEVYNFADKTTGEFCDLGKISEKTNIWGVGLILQRVMTLVHKPESLWKDNKPHNVTLEFPTKGNYHSELVKLVNRMCLYDQGERPTVDQALDAIYKLLHQGENDYDMSEGAAKAPADELPEELRLMGLTRHGIAFPTMPVVNSEFIDETDEEDDQ